MKNSELALFSKKFQNFEFGKLVHNILNDRFIYLQLSVRQILHCSIRF